ncbi:hypothetical protein [Kosakonia cowanii]|uniref:hypothetical protein n=1 Tax=Kosakonia cowanii TaxID=208223 RepID=UPI00289FF91E|nr:hypothetical protein [Kosakonia cowanii]
MTKFLDELEKNCGAKIERSDARVVPGTKKVDGLERIYFSDDGKRYFYRVGFHLVAMGSTQAKISSA